MVAIFRMSRMSRTSIARAALRTVATADTVVIAEEIVAGAVDVREAAAVDAAGAVDAVAVVDVTAVAMADTAADGTKNFRHGSAPIFTDNQNQ